MINEINDFEQQRMNEVLKDPFSKRRHHPVEGLPSDPKARHTCKDCHKKRYEESMIPTGVVKENNYKAWLLWRCKECHEVRVDEQRQEFQL